MGLDMYVFKVRKCSKEDIELLKNSVIDADLILKYTVLTGDSSELFEPIMPWLTKITTKISYYDIEKIVEDNVENADKCTAYITMESMDAIGFSLVPKGKDTEDVESKYVTISRKELEERYIKPVEEEVYVCKKMEPVAYWREEGELESAICDLADTVVENCGYYPLNDKMLEEIKAFDGQLAGVEEVKTDDYVYAYHEWY